MWILITHIPIPSSEKKWSGRSWTVDIGIKETILKNFCNKCVTQMIDIYLILAWSSLPYHENYMDQYVKTKRSDEFH